MRYSELKKMLKKHGCCKVEEGKRHERWYNPMTGEFFFVGRHDGEEVASGTLNSILRDAGVKRSKS